MLDVCAGDGNGYGSKWVLVAIDEIAGGVCRMPASDVPLVGGIQVRLGLLGADGWCRLVIEPELELVPPRLAFLAIMFLSLSRVCWEMVCPEPENALQ